MIALSVKQKDKTVNEVVLKKGIIACTAFAVSLPGKKLRYYYGGGFYDEERLSVVLWTDYIRPRSKTIDISDVVNVMFDGMNCDILLGSGAWISGLVVDRVSNPGFDFEFGRFMDNRVLVRNGDVTIVDMLSIQPKPVEQEIMYNARTPDKNILKYPYPLTLAYIKNGDETQIGYWDMINNKIVGKPVRMGVPLDTSG